ncbi:MULTISPECIES: hypothetical protein [unclassified Aureispira]|uniref:hypothetical protein n=1 Tax=unclassified Aureispira TaxID=2649989 RepID=UPI000696AFAA|nr:MULTISPECIES: hypothetical protein [unclassified Aureispira]WMX15158.1 hypothetical protein QP953_02085 [Aureispira sp. CCB-E]
MVKYIVWLIPCLSLMVSCGEKRTVSGEKDETPLAQAAGQYLYPSAVVGIGAGMTPKDSLYQLKVHTEQWIRDQLMLNVAKQNIGVTEEIERMVKAYEATLIMNAYEEALINQRLNTEVTPQELADYYSNNKEQYQAGISWARCHFVKVKRGTPELQKLKKWFKSDDGVDFERVKLFCAKNKTVHILNEDLWIEYDKLVKELPEDAIGNRHRENQSVLDRMDDNYQYLLQIFEYRDKEDAAPLPQVQDEIKRIILHQRRNKILQDIRKEVYEKAKKEGAFEVY